MPTPLRRATRRLLDAPHLPIALFLAYYGADTLIGGRGPTALERIVPDWLTATWAGALIAGGILVVLGVTGARTRAESSGHAFHIFGLTLFAAANLVRLDVGDTVAILMLAAVAAMRMGVLARSREARREAVRFLRGESR